MNKFKQEIEIMRMLDYITDITKLSIEDSNLNLLYLMELNKEDLKQLILYVFQNDLVILDDTNQLDLLDLNEEAYIYFNNETLIEE